MSHPVVLDITFSRTLVSGSGASALYNWDITYTCVTSAGTRVGPETKGYANKTTAQVQALMGAIAVAYDNAEKNPPAPAVKAFPGVYDATTLTQITDPTDPNLPPGVTP